MDCIQYETTFEKQWMQSSRTAGQAWLSPLCEAARIFSSRSYESSLSDHASLSQTDISVLAAK